jgi:hypothetical protein
MILSACAVIGSRRSATLNQLKIERRCYTIKRAQRQATFPADEPAHGCVIDTGILGDA